MTAIGRIISDDDRVAADRDIVEQQHYFVSELEARRSAPRDDFLTDLLNAELPADGDVEGGALDIPEMLSIIRQIQVAGSETTASLLSDLAVQLAQHPQEWERLKADPEGFNPDRERLNSHIVFGHGIHFCLGAALARLEAVTALKVLAARIDTMSVVDPDSLRYGSSFILRGLQGVELDVTYR